MSRLIAVFLVALLGCTSSSAADSSTAVATVYPLAWVVSEVAPDLDVTSLAAGGQDPHDLELSPSSRAVLERAALVVYLGDIGFQPQVEAAVGSAQGQVVSATSVAGEQSLLRTEDGEEVDPHLWFDPSLLASVAEDVGEAAARANPAQADTYRANAADVAEQLRSLAQDIDRLLATCRQDTVIVGHEAFAYLLERHGLTQQGISGAGGHSEASPQDIADLSAQIEAEGLPAVLSEPVEGRTDAEAVAREADVEVIEVSSLDIVTPEQAEQGFPALLLEQAQAVSKAAECGAGTL